LNTLKTIVENVWGLLEFFWDAVRCVAFKAQPLFVPMVPLYWGTDKIIALGVFINNSVM